MKKMKSINKRITTYFTVFIIVLIATTLITTSIIFSDSFIAERIKFLQEKTSYMLTSVEKQMDIVRDFSFRIRNDAAILTQLESVNVDEVALNARLDTLANMTLGIKSAFIINANGEILNSYYKNYKEKIHNEIGNFLSQGSKEEYFSPPNNFPYDDFDEFKNNQYITYISSIRDAKNFNRNYSLFISIKKSEVFPDLNRNSIKFYDNCSLFSRSGDLINFQDVKDSKVIDSAKNIAQGIKENGYKIFRNDIYFAGFVPQYPDWIIVNSVSMTNFNKDFYNLLCLLFLIGIILIFLGFFVSKIISRKITKPVLDLQKAMSSFVDGDMSARVNFKGEDEIGGLVSGFNNMADRMVEFITEIYDSGEEKKKSEIMVLKFQIELLQSQINPHFLYNTLNTVSYLALKNRTEEIRQLIQSLNILLRSTLSNQDEFVTIKKELEFLDSYVKIQNFRYENLIDIVYNVPEDVQNVLIPKLILQPLVENSLLHGIYPKGESVGHIHITVSRYKNGVEVIVSDDGVGMSEEKIVELKNSIETGGFNRIGLSNVNDRLKIYYKEALTIKTFEGIGTTISFYVPIDEVKDV